MGKLIRLLLVDGSPNGIKTLEISNMTIYGTIFPRTRLKEFEKRREALRPGCYILLGKDLDKSDSDMVYIGEGSPVLDRLNSHTNGKNKKDFWEKALVFTSKDEYLTKTQIQYLEARLYNLVKEADRIMLDNVQTPSIPRLSEVDESEMEHFLSGIRLILNSIGIDILESRKIKKKEEISKEEKIFDYSIKNARARMVIENDKYVILRGSSAVKENRPSAHRSIVDLREGLIRDKVLDMDQEKDLYIFTEDYAFDSPSYAAGAISGGNDNGRERWKHKGRSLNEIEAEKAIND